METKVLNIKKIQKFYQYKQLWININSKINVVNTLTQH